MLNRTDTDNSGLIQQRTWKVKNLASPLVYDWILCFGTAILFQKPLCKYHVSHCWYGNNPTNEKCRNPWKIKASGTSWSRGWENRNPRNIFYISSISLLLRPFQTLLICLKCVLACSGVFYQKKEETHIIPLNIYLVISHFPIICEIRLRYNNYWFVSFLSVLPTR